VFAGIDVGAEAIHCVVLDRSLAVAGAWLYGADELDDLVLALRGAAAIGVDAPAAVSTMPHREDASLAGKFRVARCAEIALGREYGWWVPWVAPAERPDRGWMATGLRVYEALRVLGVPVLEVFPHAGFRSLRPDVRLPNKRTIAGVRARVDLLIARGVRADDALMWSHDALDALLGALVAFDYTRGAARRVGCGHDDSAIWLPAAPAAVPAVAPAAAP
jgi:predicted nuclease with RNAse H fold